MTPAELEIIRRDARPPIEMEAAPSAGSAGVTRATARQRPLVTPRLLPSAQPGLDPTDHRVREMWSRLIGRGAVADLMRLKRAAERGVRIRRPIHLPTLISEGLVHHSDDQVIVLDRFPAPRAGQLRRLPPRVRSHWVPASTD